MRSNHHFQKFCLPQLFLLWLASTTTTFVHSFLVAERLTPCYSPRCTRPFVVDTTTTTASCSLLRMSKMITEISQMKVVDIRNELKERNIDFADCFDKESLMARLQGARSGKVLPAITTNDSSPTATTESPQQQHSTTLLNQEEEEDKVRAMSVRELRHELAQRQIRWAGLLEKEDLIQAVLKARIQTAAFSVTGLLLPGQVTELTGAQVQEECSSSSSIPMLLDVYATWCGPCQMVAPQIQLVAKELGDKIRVAKMDSDANPNVSSQLRVQGLPSIILFDKNGKEVDRIEGALMKDQLLQWINSKVEL